mgnify:CR=1 FL=1
MPTSHLGLDIFRVAGSMVVILLLLGAMYWILRKLKEKQIRFGKSPNIEIVETLNLGTRQKIALIRVDGQRILIGVTTQQISNLAQWTEEKPVVGYQREA